MYLDDPCDHCSYSYYSFYVTLPGEVPGVVFEGQFLGTQISVRTCGFELTDVCAYSPEACRVALSGCRWAPVHSGGGDEWSWAAPERRVGTAPWPEARPVSTGGCGGGGPTGRPLPQPPAAKRLPKCDTIGVPGSPNDVALRTPPLVRSFQRRKSWGKRRR